MKLSVVVPVYNSADTLVELVQRLDGVLRQCADEFEIILVNDGSRDQSWSVIQNLAQKYECLRGLNMLRNYGQHNALLCGIRSANYPITITLDDDLQNPPEEIPKLLAKLEEGYDVVFGAREKERNGLWRDAASQVTKLVLARVMGAEVATKISSFKAFRTDLRKAFADYSGSMVLIDVLFTWGTNKFACVEVKHLPRTVGQSNYGFRQLTVHAINMITGFTSLPLQISSLYGMVCIFLGIVLLVYVIFRTMAEQSAPPGFPFLASIVLVFSGAQLLALGIIGEYIARIHVRLQDRPTYCVGASISGKAETKPTRESMLSFVPAADAQQLTTPEHPISIK